MKKILMLLASVLVAMSSFAFNFAGTTWKSNPVKIEGVDCTYTLTLKANGTFSTTFTAHAKGHKPVTFTGKWWIDGDSENDYIYMQSSTTLDRLIPFIAAETGEMAIMSEELKENGKPLLVFRQQKNAGGNSTGTKKTTTRKKR